MTGPDHIALPEGSRKEAGVLTDVKIGEPSYRIVFVVVLVLFVAMMIGVPVGRRLSSTQWIITGIIAGILIVILLRLRVVFLRRRIAEGIRRSREERIASIARFTINRELASISYPMACLEFMKCLAADGRVGETILLWSKTRCGEIEPVSVPFEARLLDESDGAFDELDTALSNDERLIEETAGRMRRSRDDVLGLRRMKRNIRMNGGR